MKYLAPIILALLTACSNQSFDGYIIEGKISGKTPAKIYLQSYTDGKMINIDSSEFTNGEFIFKGKIDLPERYFFKVGSNRAFPFFIENSQISINGNIDSLNNTEINGSKTQDEYKSLQNKTKVFDNELDALYKEYKATDDTELKSDLDTKMDSVYDAKMEFIKNYVYTNTNTIISPFLIRTQLIHSINLDELEKLTNSLNPGLKPSKYTAQLIKRIDLLRTLQPGMEAPAFSQETPEGEMVNLSDFKGQYLLIDFWASWCGPCRKANPTVVDIYNKYNTKGFNVLGISLDDSKERWLKAIEQDNLTWKQVSTLNKWENPVRKQYGVNSIPHAVLIDPDGKIIQRGVEPEELDGILENLLTTKKTTTN